MLQVDHLGLNIPPTTKPRVVIIGGGFGGINLIKNLPKKDFQIILLDRQNYNGFWPLLYQVATAGLEPDAIGEPFRKMFGGVFPDFHFRLVRVTEIDTATQTVTTVIGDLTYDYLVIATGTRSNDFGMAWVKQFAFPLKRIPHALDLRSHLLQIFEQANMIKDEAIRQKLLNIVIVGGGPIGIEVAGALAEMRKHVLPRDYSGIDFSKMNIFLAEGLDRVLPLMSANASSKSYQYLQKMGVTIFLNTRVDSYNGEVVRFSNGREIPAQTVIWAAGVTGNLIKGLPADRIAGGRILVNEFNQVTGLQTVFAIGDIAMMKSKGYPKGHPGVAQPAIQQGKHLAANLKRLLRNKPLQPFHYFNKGDLAIIGRNRAVGDFPFSIRMSGLLPWITWLVVHIYYSIGFRNKLVVVTNWIYRYFTYQRGNRLIIRAFLRQEDKAGQELVARYQDN
jgi:NADH:ubiquinone reductase (H+-translocating)